MESSSKLAARLRKLVEDIPPAPYSEERIRTESFGHGQECENARLAPLIAGLIECAVQLQAYKCDTWRTPACTCGDCEALARLEKLCLEIE